MRCSSITDTTCAETEPSPEFYIAVFCDTTQRGSQAMALCDRLISRFNREFLFHTELCKFDFFCQTTEAAQPALTWASQATLVLLATGSPMPERFWAWMETWAQGARGTSSVVAALRCHGDSATSADLTTLEQLCRRHGIDLITSADDVMPQPAPPASQRVGT